MKSYSTNVKTAVEFASRVMSYTTASEFLMLRDILLKRVLELKNHSVSIPAKGDASLKFYRGASDESFCQLVNVITLVVVTSYTRYRVHRLWTVWCVSFWRRLVSTFWRLVVIDTATFWALVFI
jgi:hypothetical protein